MTARVGTRAEAILTRRDQEEAKLDAFTRIAAAEFAAEGTSIDRLLEQARIRSCTGDVLGALTGYRAAVLRDPTSVVARVGMALELLEYSLVAPTSELRLLRLDSAFEQATSALAIDPRAARAHSALARIVAERSRAGRREGRGAAMQAIAEALAHARRAVDLDPNDADALEFIAARAIEWQRVGRVARAVARLLPGASEVDALSPREILPYASRAVSLQRESLLHRLTLARAQRLAGDRGAARAQLDVILRAEPVRPSDVAAQQAAEREW